MCLRVCIIALLCSLGLNAQKMEITAQVFDAETREEIPYVNLWFLKLNKGASASAEGVFKFALDSTLLKENVVLSCVGYTRDTLSVQELIAKTPYLEKSTAELDEVTIVPMRNESRKRVNSFSGRRVVGLGNFSGGAYPSALARYYEKPKGFDKACFLQSVEVQFYQIYGTLNPSGKFRLRIMSVGDNGKPERDLLGVNLIISRDDTERKLEIDLLPYRLRVPEKGIFVCVEHLFIEENAFVEEIPVKLNDTAAVKLYEVTRYGPIFKGIEVSQKDDEERSFYRSITGWKPVNLLNTQGSTLEGKFPAPAFKLVFTD